MAKASSRPGQSFLSVMENEWEDWRVGRGRAGILMKCIQTNYVSHLNPAAA